MFGDWRFALVFPRNQGFFALVKRHVRPPITTVVGAGRGTWIQAQGVGIFWVGWTGQPFTSVHRHALPPTVVRDMPDCTCLSLLYTIRSTHVRDVHACLSRGSCGTRIKEKPQLMHVLYHTSCSTNWIVDLAYVVGTPRGIYMPTNLLMLLGFFFARRWYWDLIRDDRLAVPFQVCVLTKSFENSSLRKGSWYRHIAYRAFQMTWN